MRLSQLPTSNFQLLFFGIVICCALGFVAPSIAFAQGAACQNVPASFPTVCMEVCDAAHPTVANYGTLNAQFNTGGRCPAGASNCCMTLGDAACNAEAMGAGFKGGACRATCNWSEKASPQPASTCPAQQRCCYAGASAGSAKQLPDPLGGVNIPTFFGNVIRTFVGISGAIALGYFVYGGFMLILSGGDAGKVKSGKTILTNAAIGLFLIFTAYTLVSSIIDIILAPS